MTGPATLYERLAVVLSHAVADGEVCFTGLTTGQATATYGALVPFMGMALAQRLHAPNLTILLAGWCHNPAPGSLRRLPTAEFSAELLDLDCEAQSPEYPWSFSIRRGDVDVGFSSGAQIDRWGNLNSVCIGEYARPKVRLVGPILQPEHFALFGREIVMMPRHEPRVFVERVDFVSGVGFPSGRAGRAALGLPGGGPALVVTPLCLFDFDEAGAMRVASIHPGVSEAELRASTGFDLGALEDVPETPEPTADELQILREEVDPDGLLR
jgi:glutaconate CoA-transferase subunit B